MDRAVKPVRKRERHGEQSAEWNRAEHAPVADNSTDDVSEGHICCRAVDGGPDERLCIEVRGGGSDMSWFGMGNHSLHAIYHITTTI